MKSAEYDGNAATEDLKRWEDTPLIHMCEVCGRVETLTPKEAFEAGWDYPPRMGSFGVVSPRTCGCCNITKTAWWALVVEHKNLAELTDAQRNAVARILSEPASILPA